LAGNVKGELAARVLSAPRFAKKKLAKQERTDFNAISCATGQTRQLTLIPPIIPQLVVGKPPTAGFLVAQKWSSVFMV
jgi:hypothetical protein